jgi:hypothetical protein
MLSKYKLLNVPEERLDLYLKLKDAVDYQASVIHNHELHVKHRLRATLALNAMAKTLRLFIMDEEKMQELEEEVDNLKQLFTERQLAPPIC